MEVRKWFRRNGATIVLVVVALAIVLASQLKEESRLPFGTVQLGPEVGVIVTHTGRSYIVMSDGGLAVTEGWNMVMVDDLTSRYFSGELDDCMKWTIPEPANSSKTQTDSGVVGGAVEELYHLEC